ncbi:hypothetical protein [Sulfobacillus thermosulfidooxidans]|uniref:hypothetical protein n=1 Tax=Sulfobacillus thermosulfidooxidans TaxID=28034 RepID=UPI0006B54143|nr:hypothetical protein [Sulfobacillus thermosulfidooxidans]
MTNTPAIRLFVSIANIISWIGLGIAALWSIGTFISLTVMGRPFFGLLAFILIAVLGGLWWIGFRMIPEILHLLLQMAADLHDLAHHEDSPPSSFE